MDKRVVGERSRRLVWNIPNNMEERTFKKTGY